MRNLRRKMDTPTVVLSISSANFMDTLQPADSSIFNAPCDVHFFYLARSRYGPAWRATAHLSLGQLKVMSAIEQCRTAALGGHVLRCSGCGHRGGLQLVSQSPLPKCQAVPHTAGSKRARPICCPW